MLITSNAPRSYRLLQDVSTPQASGFHSCRTMMMKSSSCDTTTSFSFVLILSILKLSVGLRSRVTFFALSASVVMLLNELYGREEEQQWWWQSVRCDGRRGVVVRDVPFVFHLCEILSHLLRHGWLMSKYNSFMVANDVAVEGRQRFKRGRVIVS